MNDIIAFVKGAIKRDFRIEARSTEACYWMNIYNSNNDYIEISYWKNGDLYISTHKLNSYHISGLSEKDILDFQITFLEAKEYSKNKTLQFFDEFLGEEPSKKITNINDLDDDDA